METTVRFENEEIEKALVEYLNNNRGIYVTSKQTVTRLELKTYEAVLTITDKQPGETAE
jgi:hypothetical protein